MLEDVHSQTSIEKDKPIVKNGIAVRWNVHTLVNIDASKKYNLYIQVRQASHHSIQAVDSKRTLTMIGNNIISIKVNK